MDDEPGLVEDERIRLLAFVDHGPIADEGFRFQFGPTFGDTGASKRMKFEPVRSIPRPAVERHLKGSADEIAQALLSISYYEVDRAWVLDQLEAVAKHPDEEVRGLVATCLGHIARIDRRIDIARVGPLLERLASDPELAGRVADAWEDIERFTSGRRP